MECKATSRLQTQVSGQTQTLLADTLQTGMLNQLLRQQLSPAKPSVPSPLTVSKPTQQQPQTLLSTAVAAVSEALDNKTLTRDVLHQKLSDLFFQQKNIYQQTDIAPVLRKRQFISKSGLIISPDHCITTQLDDLRVRSYLRGIDKALADLHAVTQHPIRIVYPACGPFAPLLMPLLGYYKETKQYTSEQIQVTLIDMQQGAVLSLQALVNEMGIKDYIQDIYCIDALDYAPGQTKFDLVVLEAMQHGFSSEGHFPIARHFSRFLATNGHFIPHKVSVRAMLTNGHREYIEQWQNSQQISALDMDPAIKAERIDLGEILSLTAKTLTDLQEVVLDESTVLIKCGQVKIPSLADNQDQLILILCTEVQTYADEWLGEYDSGITHPLPDLHVCVNFVPRDTKPGDLLLNSGDHVLFYYRLNGLPGFMATWTEGAAEHD